MKRARPFLALLAAVALGAAACSRGEAAPPPAPAQSAPLAAAHASGASVAAPAPVPPAAAPAPAAGRPSAALPRLVFFMNPNGRPCQIQDQVLHEMAGQLAGRVEVVYVRTTEANDIPAFQRYGIRALPTLLLADSAGTEIRRAPPGIQSAPQVLQLLAP